MAFRAYILTASDAGSRGEREDLSAPAAEKLLREAGYEIAGYALLPDEREMLASKMREVADGDLAELLVTTGGTGFSPRDCTPEATADVTERAVPGIPEAMRLYSLQLTPRAMLSRAAAGIRKGTLIVNLPGSPKAVAECLEYILPALEHGLEILRGTAHNCARK
jgi:molybdenum cofactor synthesis domain-containing protein